LVYKNNIGGIFKKMIRLIRTDGMEILINSTMIEALNLGDLESGVGTVITLGTGEQVLVKNTRSDIMQKIGAYRMGLAEARREEEKKKAALEKKET
jgi:uncharacterized protein YlzI (FlbEa/FlbD family)